LRPGSGVAPCHQPCPSVRTWANSGETAAIPGRARTSGVIQVLPSSCHTARQSTATDFLNSSAAAKSLPNSLIQGRDLLIKVFIAQALQEFDVHACKNLGYDCRVCMDRLVAPARQAQRCLIQSGIPFILQRARSHQPGNTFQSRYASGEITHWPPEGDSLTSGRGFLSVSPCLRPGFSPCSAIYGHLITARPP